MDYYLAYLCFFDHHLMPRDYDALPLQDKAFIAAAYKVRAKELEAMERRHQAEKGGM